MHLVGVLLSGRADRGCNILTGIGAGNAITKSLSILCTKVDNGQRKANDSPALSPSKSRTLNLRGKNCIPNDTWWPMIFQLQVHRKVEL